MVRSVNYVRILEHVHRAIVMVEHIIIVVQQLRRVRVIKHVPRLVLGMRHHLVRTMRHVRIIPVILHLVKNIMEDPVMRHPVHVHCPVFHVMQITINLVHHVRRVLICLTQIVKPTPKQ